MTTPLIKRMKGLTSDPITAEGLLYNDWEAVSPCQVICVEKLAHTIQLEEEAYLIKHPEIIALLKILVCKSIRESRRKDILKLAARHFTKPYKVLDKEIRQVLKVPPGGSYWMTENRKCGFEVTDLESDLEKAILELYPLIMDMAVSSEPETPNTTSSSFISSISSSTTQPTPEPIPTPEPTLSQIFMKMVVNCMDKATASKLNDDIIKYDTAYVEVMKIVEVAMEIPVLGVREDIANLLGGAYEIFQEILDERAKIAADIAWDRRMRKKLKRSIRRQDNFRGYKTPPTPTSSLPSSHASYRIPPPRPCKCHPQWSYNRYPKDRFGIYLPLGEEYLCTSITVSPRISNTDLTQSDTNIAAT